MFTYLIRRYACVKPRPQRSGVGDARQELFASGEDIVRHLVGLGVDVEGNDFALMA